jgi:hypothetical protein
LKRSAKETAYYFNGKLRHLALIETLVRDLFPLVKDAKLPFSALLTDFDVDEFEQALGKGKTGT